MQHTHTFDVRDTNHSRCLDCKQLVNDAGKAALPVSRPVSPLIDWLNNLAKSVGVYSDTPGRGSYRATVETFGK